MGIISAVKQSRNNFKPDTKRENASYNNFRPIFFQANKPNKVVYQKLADNKRKLPKKESQEMVFRLHVWSKWMCGLEKRSEIQFKLIQKRLPTYSFVKKFTL